MTGAMRSVPTAATATATAEEEGGSLDLEVLSGRLHSPVDHPLRR